MPVLPRVFGGGFQASSGQMRLELVTEVVGDILRRRQAVADDTGHDQGFNGG
jgi:hypothetical protein